MISDSMTIDELLAYAKRLAPVAATDPRLTQYGVTPSSPPVASRYRAAPSPTNRTPGTRQGSKNASDP